MTLSVVDFIETMFIESPERVRDVKRVCQQFYVHVELWAVHAVMDLCIVSKQHHNY